MTTTTTHRPGTKAWHDRVLTGLRRKYGDGAKLATISAKMDADTADPFLFTARITKDVLDRDGEVLLPGGMDATDFDKSGAVFYNHDYNLPVAAPVGKLKKTAEAIIGRARFMERVEGDTGEFLPDYVRSFVTCMAKAGRSAGVSIGFDPIESRMPTKKDREVYGPGITLVFTRWKLLEWSIAPVQANQEAFVTAMGKSLDAAVCKSLFGTAPKAKAPAPDVGAETAPPDLSLAALHTKLYRSARAQRREAKRAEQARATAMARLKSANIMASADIARAKVRGELYVGQFDR
ncbi:MAG: hypothetical protein ACPGVG_02535 [Mycobacterium sp.]